MRRPNAPKFQGVEISDCNCPTTMEPIPNHPFHQPRSAKPKQSIKPYAFGFVAVLASASFFLYAIFHAISDGPRPRFRLFIDAGSTGTRIHVIEYSFLPGSRLDFVERGALRVNPGLSSYAENPSEAAKSLSELVKYGQSIVPNDKWAATEVRLMATAGMRLLETNLQTQIIEESRRVLRASGFKFKDEWATVIPGSDEGLYAWVVANYALGSLGSEPSRTTGIVELGGASAQVFEITFVSSTPVPWEFSRTINFKNITYSMYSHSLLHFGQNAAFDAVRDSLARSEHKLDPCTPKGYASKSVLSPSGNFSECKSAILSLLQKGNDKCPYTHCSIGSSFVPGLPGKVLATENFFYTSKFLGLNERATLSEMADAGRRICAEDWTSLIRKGESAGVGEQDLEHYCFSTAYIVALLHDSLGIALDDRRVRFANELNAVPLDWALGAFILQTDGDSVNDSDSEVGVVLVVLSLLVVLTFAAVKWKKTGLKTIYDLEKGRYIVTRIIRNS